MAYGRQEITHEFEGRVEFTTAKAKLVEVVFTGVKYWIPKSQIVDFNESGIDQNDNTLFMFVVTNWWYKKKEDFKADEK